MKKIGILGGVGWPSTIEYYKLICENSQHYHRDNNFSGQIPMPEMVIESLDMAFTINNRGSSEPGSWTTWDTYFKEALHRLQQSGAELIAIASVTPHARLNEITREITVPVISVYQCIAEYCVQAGIKQLLVLGTMPTMSNSAFVDAMAKSDINAFYPETDDLKQKVVTVIDALYQNQIEGTASALDQIVRTCIEDGPQEEIAVCLGCTELPLAFGSQVRVARIQNRGIDYLNSSVIHAAAVFKACVS